MVACNLTLEEIGTLAETLEKNNLERIKIKNGDCEIVLEAKRKCPPPPHHPPMMPPMGAPVMQPAMSAAPSAAPETAPAAKESIPEGNIVKSPIVGTFYSAPSPDKAPFVKVGDSVKKGDVIMIIESMKLMNEIQSDFDGTVAEILVNNGDSVEFDQPIMVIK
ncbi:MAG: acetyl-CoA carboxylase biotin carboxyl carrier protein [Ruminococcus sp.]|nr:acetyl-CoA carboxylase biotin carboxyl carrier protein [Ruminococcus sp.]